jgi:hypothetical protein
MHIRRLVHGEVVVLPPEGVVFLCSPLPFGFKSAFCTHDLAPDLLKAPDILFPALGATLSGQP